MLIVHRFGVRIFGAFLPLPFFPFAIAAAAAACAATGGAARGRYSLHKASCSMYAQSLRQRRAQMTRTDVGLLGDGTHAQAMAPALGARRRQAARGNRFVKARY